jgi:trehalose 6-phosphate synthase/phosphatase
MKGKLIVVSNRGPYKLARTKRGLKRTKHVGGLVTSILPMMKRRGGVWVAWGEPAGRHPGATGRSAFTLRYIHLSRQQEVGYYWGLSNTALWPLCHSFLGRVRYNADEWRVYKEVNRLFAKETLTEMRVGDLVWIHDYQLGLTPHFIRVKQPSARLAFFWHIPFPPTEIFRTFPWRAAILESLMACDLVGFHIPEYKKNFCESASGLLGAEIAGDEIIYAGHRTRTMARPIGIDYEGIACLAGKERIQRRADALRENLPRQTILLGVERMDYTKGILERLRAMENLLEQHPEFIGRVTLIQIVTPSRQVVKAYQQKKREIDEVVGRINGCFSNDQWIPIRYLFRTLTPNELMAYYRLSDIALVTPLRDGLNLVAKEFIASRLDDGGVLILSEFAGVARQLPEAILVNPYSEEEMTSAIERAICMPEEENRRRIRSMQKRIRTQDITWWTEEFLRAMNRIPDPVHPSWPETIRSAIREGERLWVFLDYDGTLVPIARTPKEAVPDSSLLDLLTRLACNGVFLPVIISGRPLASLKQMLPVSGLILAGTYGTEIQMPDGKQILRSDAGRVRPVIECIKRAWIEMIDDREGFFIEDKGMAIALHARFADHRMAPLILAKARATADDLIRGKAVRLLGGDRFLEAAPSNADKREAVDWILDRFGYQRDIPVYFGDDDKDEAAFTAIRRRGGFSFVVGDRQLHIRAFLRLQSPQDVRTWLEALLTIKNGSA